MGSRPLIFCAPAFAAAIFLCVTFDVTPNVNFLILSLAALLFAIAAALNHPRVCTALVLSACAVAGMVYLSLYDAVQVLPLKMLDQQVRTISATVRNKPVIYETNQRVELLVQGEKPFRTLCYLPLTEQPLNVGDCVEASVGFYRATSSEGFNRAAYHASNGIYILSSYQKSDNADNPSAPEHFVHTSAESPMSIRLPLKAAECVRAAIDSLLPAREGSLLTALLIGDRSDIPDNDAAAFRKAGLSHLIAVSGMHIGFLVSFCLLLFGRKWGTLFSVAAVLFFIPMAGMTPSVVRAGIMYLVAAGGFFLKKQADSLNSLFLALAILLLSNPHAIANVGLQLSFAATMGLILFASKMLNKLMRPFRRAPRAVRRLLRVIFSALSCTVCATIFTIPILFSAFGYVSVLSALSNLLMVGVVALCFVGGFLLCITYWTLPPIAQGLATCVRPMLTYMLRVAHWIADLPFGLVYLEDAYSVAALLVFSTFIVLWLLWGDKVKLRFSVPLVCGILIVLIGLDASQARANFTVSYLSCGTGQVILVSHAQKALTVIDCSGSGYHNAAEMTQEWMDWNCYNQIDTLILTAVDKGHARNLPELVEDVPVRQIIMPAGCKQTKHNEALLKTLTTTNIPVTVQRTEQTLAGEIPIQVFPIVDGKLGVRVGEDTVVLHSPTQKQLQTYLEDHSLRAKNVVLSQSGMGDSSLLRTALHQMETQRIILESGRSAMDRFDGIMIENTYEIGEISKKYKLRE